MDASPRSVALVTGAASGIGRAVAQRLAAGGRLVVALDVDGPGLEALAGELSGSVVPFPADVGSAEDCSRAVDAAAALGRLEVVVNVAGIMVDDDSVETIADDDLERLFRVNVFGVVRLARAAIPALRRGGGGVIVNVSSVHAYASQERAAAYGASKGAVSTLTRQMAVDLAKDGIRVVGVAPGSVDTPLTRAEIRRRGVTIEEAGFSRDPRALGHVADPADIAEVVAFLASEQAAIVTGQTLIADGGLLTRFAGS